MRSLVLESMRRRGQIYILPTRMGGYLNGLIFLMFLLSVGYSNNLLLIFTLFLFGLNLLWVIQTHFYLRDLKFERLHLDDGFAEARTPFRVIWSKAPRGPLQWELRLEAENVKLPLSVLETSPREVAGEVQWPKRGVFHWRYLFIATERPFGLYRAWRYVKVEGATHVYPALTRATLTTPLSGLGLLGDVGTGDRGEGDFQELLPYQGEEARKISWKHYARGGELLIKEGEDERSPLAEFVLTSLETEDKEEKLRVLAGQMVHCHRQNIPFTFKAGPHKQGPDTSPRHLARCLEVLARC